MACCSPVLAQGAQWENNRPPSQKEKTSKLGGNMCCRAGWARIKTASASQLREVDAVLSFIYVENLTAPLYTS